MQKIVPDIRRCREDGVTRRVARLCDGIRSSGIRYSEKGEKCYDIDAADKWDYSVEIIEKKACWNYGEIVSSYIWENK